MSKTTIEWTERTWNPVRGCSPVSPGCVNCYAEKQGGRFCGPGKPFEGFIQIGKNGKPGPHWTGKVELIEHMLEIPLRTRKPTTWFVNSMSDLFHENLPDEVIDRVFAVMALCPQHTFQVLTKRSKRMREWASRSVMGVRIHTAIARVRKTGWGNGPEPPFPLPNVWLGVSVEDRERKVRIDDLRETPAAVRFLSIEPQLEDLGDISAYLKPHDREECGCGSDWEYCPFRNRIGWVIVGGESGPGARPFDIAWARSIVQQCADAGVPCFVKQLGAHPREGNANGNCRSVNCTHPDCGWMRHRLKDRKGGDMAEWPEYLRVRQMPEPR